MRKLSWFVVGAALSGCASFSSAETNDTDDEMGSTTTASPDSTTSAATMGTTGGGAESGPPATTAPPPTTDTPPTATTSSSDTTTSSDNTTSDDTAGDDSSSSGERAEGFCGDGQDDPGESCDDANDDELDGCTVNCLPAPFGVELDGRSTSDLDGGGGGVVNDDMDSCPPGQVLIGLEGGISSEGWIGIVRGQCQQLRASNATPPLTEIDGNISLTPPRGGFGMGGSWSTTCPPNQVIVAVSGGAGSVIDGLAIHCAGLDTVGDEGGYVIERGGVTELPRQGGPGGGPFGPLTCPGDGAATGLRVRTSSYLNQIQLLCRDAAFDY